jgi:hypothetical protein
MAIISASEKRHIYSNIAPDCLVSILCYKYIVPPGLTL